jgi:DNA-binding response OmpR family regulator
MASELGQAPRRVLVVDDDAALLRMIRLALVSDGFDVTVAPDGFTALDCVSAASFDVIVLDLQMPRMDGRTTYREIRSRGHTTPILIVSAFGAESARIELDANDALNKPFDTEALVERVSALAGLQSPDG